MNVRLGRQLLVQRQTGQFKIAAHHSTCLVMTKPLFTFLLHEIAKENEERRYSKLRCNLAYKDMLTKGI